MHEAKRKHTHTKKKKWKGSSCPNFNLVFLGYINNTKREANVQTYEYATERKKKKERRKKNVNSQNRSTRRETVIVDASTQVSSLAKSKRKLSTKTWSEVAHTQEHLKRLSFSKVSSKRQFIKGRKVGVEAYRFGELYAKQYELIRSSRVNL